MAQSPSNISTRPALKSVSNSTPKLPSRPLCVFGMPPILITGPFAPDSDFQTNRLAVLCPPPKPIRGLGLDCVDLGNSRSQVRLPLIPRRPALRPRLSSSFDCDKSMASLKLGPNPLPRVHPATSPVIPALSFGKPTFNSLRDLDIQYTSCLSLNALSPQSPPLNYSYSPVSLSPSWSLDSMLTPSAFSSPDSTSSSPSSDIRPCASSWLSRIPSSVKTEATLDILLTPDMTVPFLVDVNMFSESASPISNSGVNPAHITLDHSPLPSINTSPQDVFTSTHYDVNGFTTSVILNVSPSLSPMCDDDSPLPSIVTSPQDVFISTEFHHYDPNGFTRSLMHIAGASTPACGDGSPNNSPVLHRPPSVLPDVKVAPRPRLPKRKSSTQDVSVKKKEPERAVDFGSPILNAHHGITQAELEAKASRYKQRNPEAEDYDKQWLASFSGKLSAMGEMVDHFRCYVDGCTQVNRRRDHMVAHIGSHLNQRQFKCDKCSSRFARNNELKRHQLSHDGSRPFTCTQCPATFKRQDLLARHLKNTHESGKENAPRKKIKLEKLEQ
ncbi:hypothetical protein C8R47DRAFT_1035182 [Mycena vitilis]|nr:hypothetical protein C8R47DRAFT_1035182 [Mycena vitilis]